VAIQCGLTDIIPTECGCERQIGLFQALNAWVEDDDYVPLPGDLIYYHRNCMELGDCKKRSDHVGIVVGTNGDRMKVIEGNYGDGVGYRYLKVDATIIRGYATPDYTSLIQ
jgi:cell wall-associated NlpC family hydrolase